MAFICVWQEFLLCMWILNGCIGRTWNLNWHYDHSKTNSSVIHARQMQKYIKKSFRWNAALIQLHTFSCFSDRRVWILRLAYLEIIMQIVGVSLIQVNLDPFSHVAGFHVFVGYGQFDFWRFAPWIRRHGRCLSL